jgi:hypothetical protein
MKKIAIIGCSHSAYNRGEQNWSTMFPDDFIIHNYSMSGHGVQYFDFILKYIVANKLDYDCVIIQLTHTSRWQFPITGYSSNKLHTMVISDRYINYAVNYAHATAHDTVDYEDLYANHQMTFLDDVSIFNGGFKQSRDDIKQTTFEQFGINRFQQDTWVTEYYNLFVQTLHMYENYFPNVFWWRFASTPIDNIGHDAHTALETVISKKELYGDLNDIIDDTLHLTPLGYRILFDEYIMKSKIGDYVRSNTNDKSV